MDTSHHDLNGLFEQLGLSSKYETLDHFIDQHRGLDNTLRLEEAPFWSDAQRQFIVEAQVADAEWTEPLDQLSNLLR